MGITPVDRVSSSYINKGHLLSVSFYLEFCHPAAKWRDLLFGPPLHADCYGTRIEADPSATLRDYRPLDKYEEDND